MRVIAELGNDDVANVYIAESETGRKNGIRTNKIEFVEALKPPFPRERKWVNIVSTLYGCPVQCPICDAGMNYRGKLNSDDLLFQIDYLVNKRFPDGIIPCDQWKIQFSRMGEPAFNMAVIDVLESLPERYKAPGLMPSISTVAPESTDHFFERLLVVKRQLYPEKFQFQFSVHSTDEEVRRQLIPCRTWDFSKMARYGEEFYSTGGRKITLNFALIDGVPVNADKLLKYFDPDIFLIKLTPLNPTLSAETNEYSSKFDSQIELELITGELKSKGFEVIHSLGELEENAIGSNCGQYVSMLEKNNTTLQDAYTYPVNNMINT
ncbi:MAG: hypothetical protein P9L92_12620 [Candidatus Electryonea clarkiae]|nr:hypothetical protein [Candidatus Electryonea clarkiae]MDP8285042.1 hypothetical protein [Candidatus Electryonea clarkiae]